MDSRNLCFAPAAPCVGSFRRHAAVSRSRPQARLAKVTMTAAIGASGVDAAKDALADLLEANKIFADDASARKHPHPVSPAKLRNDLVVYGQTPSATIITGSDSRAPPELFFRGAVGSQYILRTAGNVTDDAAIIASIEYAVAVLKTPLVLVVGHRFCDAVTAALNYKLDDAFGASLPLNLSKHLSKMAATFPPMPAFEGLTKDQILDACVEINAIDAARKLPVRSKVVADAVKNREILIAVAIYDTSSGIVRVVEEEKLGDLNNPEPAETGPLSSVLSWLRS